MSFIGLKHKSREELTRLLDVAGEFVDDDGNVITPEKHRDALDGKSLAMLFFEPSTRTRVSFQLAIQRLGGFSVEVAKEQSSVKKGETFLDTCRNLEAMGFDALVMRHNERQLPFAIEDRLDIKIINAGNGSGEHPTQALLDVFTLQRAIGNDNGSLEGKTVSIIGDIVHSRVARSDVYALNALGARVVLAGPSNLVPKPEDSSWDADRASSREEALSDADAVIMLRVQSERMHGELVDENTYIREWGLDDMVVADQMKPGAVIMHPGPVIRGMELTSSVADGERSLILDQVKNGVAVRQAVLLELLGRD
ncbi:MAG: aspartate carbamoyltransferase catalytic subunit [Myxococcota bacterium]